MIKENDKTHLTPIQSSMDLVMVGYFWGRCGCWDETYCDANWVEPVFNNQVG